MSGNIYGQPREVFMPGKIYDRSREVFVVCRKKHFLVLCKEMEVTDERVVSDDFK